MDYDYKPPKSVFSFAFEHALINTDNIDKCS